MTITTNEKTKKRSSKSDPCWEGYEKIGMKLKNGRLVPNCVPKEKSKTKSSKK